MRYYHKVGLAFDQLLNALIGGMPDESISARAFRWHRDGKRSYPYKIINAMFWWMKDHCRSAYKCEQELRHMPPEYRDRQVKEL